MSLNNTVTKKSLETIVHETFCNFGFLASSSLLDSLKLLGFYYATNAGISINIEDLKTPDVKKEYIEIANQEIDGISQAWAEGMVSDQERFQSIIDSWNIATESLKNRIVDYYQNFDPANNLYIMAFSGARGNMSQVRQLVGMRGLMSDQEGKIIDLPIQANFREGLSSIDYIISSYGARKGIVDTALKTADSGYLTRRLIYLAQDLIIREIDCQTKNGVLVHLKKETTIKNLIGRELLSIKKAQYPYKNITQLNDLYENQILQTQSLNELKSFSPLLLQIRSSLTCRSNGSICQKCYGWDLAHQKLIGLGETVGIIAAQSIGEPGTQLTMRTFHTGGIFTGEALKQFFAPFSGKIVIPAMLKTFSFRTNHGINVLKLKQEASLQLINWKGIETTLFLEIGSYLYIPKTTFVYKGQLISEFLTQSVVTGQRKLKPIYTRLSGKVICNNGFPTFRRKKKGKTRRIVLKQGFLWIAAGKILTLPVEAKYLFEKNIFRKKAIAQLKISSPKSGVIVFQDSSLFIVTHQNKLELNLSNFKQQDNNCMIQIVPVVKNYQYIDAFSVIAIVYFFPTFTGNIISIEKKPSKFNNIFLISTNREIWNLYGPLGSNSLLHLDTKQGGLKKYTYLNSFCKNEVKQENIERKKNYLVESTTSMFHIISPNTFKNPILKIQQCGLSFKKDRYFQSFQQLEAICLPTSTILNFLENDLVAEKKVFATLVNYSQQTDDIVQGLPKIEELVEARKPKVSACLAIYPGIFLKNTLTGSKTLEKKMFEKFSQFYQDKGILKCLFPIWSSKTTKKLSSIKEIEEKEEKQTILLAHSFLANKNIIQNNGYFFEWMFFSGLTSLSSETIYEINKKSLAKLNVSEKKWLKFPYTLPQNQDILLDFLKAIFQFFEKKPLNWEKSITQIPLNVYYSIPDKKKMTSLSKFKRDYIVQLAQNTSIYFKHLEVPIMKYQLLATSKLLVQPGDFIDIAEPINDGIMDSHELLKILFTYHSHFDGIIEGTLKSLTKFQLILVNSIQAIYQAQGVNISTKHIEIIVRQMTSKVIIKTSGDTPFLPGELLSISLIIEMYEAFRTNTEYKTPTFEPKLLSATNSSLNKDGFLSAAGFQETRKILTKAAIEGSSDWLRGLKESLMSGRMIPAGSAFLNHKNYLDNLYYLKN